MKQLQIGSRYIGHGQPTLVIAELGVNHDGSVSARWNWCALPRHAGLTR